MFGLYIHRHEGLTFWQDYASKKEALIARAEYIAAARRQGFEMKRGLFTTRLHKPGVKLSVWVAPVVRVA